MKLLIIALLTNLNNLGNCFTDRFGRLLTHDDVLTHLQMPETERFLMGFNTSYQRWILTKQLELCPFTPLCGFSFELTPMVTMRSCCKSCDCDFPNCMQKRTCCPDIIFQNINVSDTTIITADELRLQTGQDTFKTCMPLVLSKSILTNLQVGAFGYSTCPLQTSEDIRQNCTRAYSSDIVLFEDIVPVLNKESNVLYRNRYCAYCHNITDAEFQPLDTKLHCQTVTRLHSEKSIINEVTSNDVCEIAFIPDRRLDNCLPAISTCNATGLSYVSNPQEESACALYRSVIEAQNSRFQNILCTNCNGIYQFNLQCEMQFGTEGGKDFAFSGLLKLQNKNSQNSERSSSMCSENQIYDTISHTCMDMFCPVHMDLLNGKCVDIFEKLENMMYSTFIRITPIVDTTLNEANTVADTFLDFVQRQFSSVGQICKTQITYQTGIGFGEEEKQSLGNLSLLFYDIRIQFFVNFYHEPKDLLDNVIEHINFANLQHNNSFTFRITDGDPKLFDIISILIERDTSSINHKTVDAFGSNVSIREYAFPGYQNLTAFPYLKGIDDRSCISTRKPLNILWLTSCPKVNLSKANLPWTETIDGVKIQPDGFKLKSWDYYFADENHIMVCVESFKELLSNATSVSSSAFSVETILSIICSSLSVISLAITFLVFLVLPQLRQAVPGKTNMTLVLFLMTAQMLYMLSSLGILETNSTECLILGIFVHFFWLVAMFWMNICTFHMFRVLTKVKVISHGSGLKRLISYHIYALVMAATFVSINITVSFFYSDDTGYGGEICYISSQKMVNYTFIIPTTFVVVSNILMFLFVIIKITRISSVQKNVQHERNDLNIFAKLSTITGATWIFGLLYTWTSVLVFSYLFIVLNACQGIFIMLAFVINKRVYHLLNTKAQYFTSSGNTGTTSAAFTSKT